MNRTLASFFVLILASASATPSPAREISLQAQCFNETDELAVLAIDSGPFPGSILVGIVYLADNTQLSREDLRFSATPRHAVWQGEQFLLRVHTNRPVDTDRYLGRFHGLDDSGQPLVFRNLSCAFFTP